MLDLHLFQQRDWSLLSLSKTGVLGGRTRTHGINLSDKGFRRDLVHFGGLWAINIGLLDLFTLFLDRSRAFLVWGVLVHVVLLKVGGLLRCLHKLGLFLDLLGPFHHTWCDIELWKTSV